MKKFFAVLFLLLCSASLQAKDKPDPADYTIKVHISGSYRRTECGNGVCSSTLYVNAVLGGKKIELSATTIFIPKKPMLISPGDYSVRLKKEDHNSDSSLFNQEYDLLLPDGIVWSCWTTGISE
jgi:hypothetical protein